MNKSLSKALALVAALALMPATVQATLTPAAANCAFSLYAGFAPTPTFCWGAYEGNNNNQQTDVLNLLNGAGYGSPWIFVGTTNATETTGPFSSVPGGTSGTLVFDFPVVGAFVLALKAADAFSLYYFAGNGAVPSVTFWTDGVNPPNPGSNVNGLSHASLYTLENGNVVPEPATVILLATGLLGLGIVENRRRRKA